MNLRVVVLLAMSAHRLRTIGRRTALILILTASFDCAKAIGLDEFQEHGDESDGSSPADASSSIQPDTSAPGREASGGTGGRPPLVDAPQVTPACACDACGCELSACRTSAECSAIFECALARTCLSNNCVDECSKVVDANPALSDGADLARRVATCMGNHGCSCLDRHELTDASCEPVLPDAPSACGLESSCKPLPITFNHMPSLNACCAGTECGHEFPRNQMDAQPPCVAMEGTGPLDPSCPDFVETTNPPSVFPPNTRLYGCCTPRSHICGYASDLLGCFNPGWAGGLPCNPADAGLEGEVGSAEEGGGGASGEDASAE
jgi:hypothetical protein